MNKGFTLIEILVAVTIFSLVVGAISGVFISVLQAQRKGLINQALVDNASFTLEYISRALRMARKQTSELPICLSDNGLNYETTRDNQGIKFLNYQGICHEIYLDGGRIFRDKGGEVLPLTLQDFEIASLKINLSGETETDTLQPKATIYFVMKSKDKKPEEKAELKAQTTVSQRNLDVK